MCVCGRKKSTISDLTLNELSGKSVAEADERSRLEQERHPQHRGLQEADQCKQYFVTGLQQNGLTVIDSILVYIIKIHLH